MKLHHSKPFSKHNVKRILSSLNSADRAIEIKKSYLPLSTKLFPTSWRQISLGKCITNVISRSSIDEKLVRRCCGRIEKFPMLLRLQVKEAWNLYDKFEWDVKPGSQMLCIDIVSMADKQLILSQTEWVFKTTVSNDLQQILKPSRLENGALLVFTNNAIRIPKHCYRYSSMNEIHKMLRSKSLLTFYFFFHTD